MTTRFRSPVWHRAGAGVVLALWLGVLVLAALPKLHSHVHADAADPAHQCAIATVVSGNLIFQPPPLVVAVPPAVVAVLPARLTSIFLTVVSYCQPPGRAPPAA